MDNNYPAQTDDEENRIAMARQQMMNMPNPFQGQQFNRSNLPDIPFQDDGAKMLNALLSDEGTPAAIKKKFWWVFHRDNTLTFLDLDRKKSKLLNFDILKIDALNNTPYYDYTFDGEMEWNAARHILELKLDRALGLNGKNERLTIPLTVQENINRMEDNTRGEVKEGFLKRILNRR